MRKCIVLDKPNGVQDQYAVIQNALHGGNVILDLQEGVYHVSQTLKVYSHTTIRATDRTVIRRMDHTATDISDCLITNDPVTDDGSEGIELAGGIWDMNNAANPRGTDKDKSYWGLALRFYKVNNLTIRDLTVANAETYFIRLCRINHFSILNVRLFTSLPAANQDGVHMNGYCFNGLIRGLYAISPLTPNDDMIAINAFDGLGHQNDGIELGPIENIEVEDVYAESAYGFFRILSKDQEQSVRNIRVRNCRGGVRYLFLNANAFAEARPGAGHIENVDISNIRVHKLPVNPAGKIYSQYSILGMQLHMENVVIRDFERTPLDVNCDRPTFNLHPLCGDILEYDPDPLNRSCFCQDVRGETILPEGGFRLLRIGQRKE